MCSADQPLTLGKRAGLHEGMKTLSDGGVPPKFLIIDDGWQCTDVDVPLRKPMSSRMMMLKEMQEGFNATQDEFIDAELEILARSARNLPPSSSAGLHFVPCLHMLLVMTDICIVCRQTGMGIN